MIWNYVEYVTKYCYFVELVTKNTFKTSTPKSNSVGDQGKKVLTSRTMDEYHKVTTIKQRIAVKFEEFGR